ncbi:hypothetical protein SAY87_005295 [Trapa incisa]|uniref:Uncharacterized protein n=1 Tax=Trapa incisa TaxID=236973 RepID=A0AAN7KAM5_9MYRT|nr:hypothetical protein SAY87_005295 [Trapa incisa]
MGDNNNNCLRCPYYFPPPSWVDPQYQSSSSSSSIPKWVVAVSVLVAVKVTFLVVWYIKERGKTVGGPVIDISSMLQVSCEAAESSKAAAGACKDAAEASKDAAEASKTATEAALVAAKTKSRFIFLQPLFSLLIKNH